MITELTEDEFADAIESANREAFHFETLGAYQLTIEEPEFARFLDRKPVPPPDIEWWRGWLDMVAELTALGVDFTRCRVVGPQLTPYQRWLLWSVPWHVDAGETVVYMTQEQALGLGLPMGVDWWLLDSERVIVMYFDAAGKVAGKILITEPGIVAVYRDWRDLAVRIATAADEVRAA
jgi:hypothetical protein